MNQMAQLSAHILKRYVRDAQLRQTSLDQLLALTAELLHVINATDVIITHHCLTFDIVFTGMNQSTVLTMPYSARQQLEEQNVTRLMSI
jgi:hypothetical protein